MLWQLFFFSTERKGKKRETVETIETIESYNSQPIPIDTIQESAAEPKLEVIYSESVIISEGQTLRTIALDLFGNKEFWVYIYRENMHNIKNPNIVAIGTELKMPDVSEYDINPNDPQSVAKAKDIGDRILDTFK